MYLGYYDGYQFYHEDIIKEKSYYCHNWYRGIGNDEIYAKSDDDGWTGYYLNGVEFAESFTSEGDVLHVYSEFRELTPDTHVYCTHCKHLRFCDEDLPYCPFQDECDNWNFEDSKPYRERPKYEPKKEW